MKKFKKALSYNNERCDVHHFDINNLDSIPNRLILKAHAVCFWKGKILLVNHPEWNVWSIPGGTRELGESIEQTLKREIAEETNCKVLKYKPICCEKIVSPNGEIHYRVKYFCQVKPLGEFKTDPAGNINKIIWIAPEDFEKYIEKKEFKRIIIQKAIDSHKKDDNNKNF